MSEVVDPASEAARSSESSTLGGRVSDIYLSGVSYAEASEEIKKRRG